MLLMDYNNRMKNHRLHRSLCLIIGLFALLIGTGGCAASPDTSPVIRSIEAPKEVMPLFNAPLYCNASGGSSLVYTWTTTGGVIQGSGVNVIWISPKELGEYTVTVSVKDDKGNVAQQSARITVVGSLAEELAVVSMECPDCPNKIEASKWKNYLIRCSVNVLDWTKLTYDWTATIGKIEGQGREANWQTFGQYGNSLIKVVVSDPKGKRAEGFLAVNISCCH